jgi:oxygen-independent coproporphyrinogen-3 oxidase
MESPRSAYIHVPFCARRCGYCNFTLVAGRMDLVDAYLEAVARELAALGQPREVDTLYFGGGTPTQLSPSQLEMLVKTALAWHPLRPGGEFSVEANPADVDQEKVQLLADYGVTRLSLGAQSLDDAKLKVLERDHRADQVVTSCRMARQHFKVVSLDLIFASPGETITTWASDLNGALALGPDHLSTYALTWEKGTTFFSRQRKGELAAADEEVERSMYGLAMAMVSQAGLKQYEVSSFARPGCRCRHHEVYWSGGSYYAAGPGAARYVDGRREINHRSTTTYLRRVLAGQSPVADQEVLGPEDVAREMLVLGLRRMEGVHRAWFAARTGFHLDALAGDALRRFVGLGLLDDDGYQVRLTRDGLFVSDSIWPHLLRV